MIYIDVKLVSNENSDELARLIEGHCREGWVVAGFSTVSTHDGKIVYSVLLIWTTTD